MVKKMITPITLFIGLIYATTQSIAFEYYILLVSALIISFIAFSPLELISSTWSPGTRIIVSTVIIFLTALIWIKNIQTIICILFCSTLMLVAAYRFNGRMMQNYNFVITKRQQVAISERSDIPCFKAWDNKGKRECDTMLREYMNLSISSDDLERIARPSYLIGYLTAQDKNYTAVEGEMKDIKKTLEIYEKDYDKLQKDYRELQKDYNRLVDKNKELNTEIYYIKLSLAENRQVEASQEKKIDIDSEIIRLKTEEPTLSLQAIADKVGSKKSHVQYVLKKAII